MAFALRVRIREFKIAPGDFVFCLHKRSNQENAPRPRRPRKSTGATLEKRALLQGRMDAPSGLIHAEMHIPVHFALASHAFRGDAQGAQSNSVAACYPFSGDVMLLGTPVFPVP